MQQKELTGLAIICIIIGLTTLYFVLPDKTQDTAHISIKGKVESVVHKDKISLIKIHLSTPLTIVSFQQQDFNKDDEIKVTGRLQEYRGRVEILATTIETT